MNRRQFVFSIATAAALSGLARDGRAECGELTSNEFVGELYEKQARLHAASTRSPRTISTRCFRATCES